MKKIYLKTTLLIPILLIFIVLSCEKKIDWRMSVSAPQHYGATIQAEYFSEGKSVAAIRGGGSSGWGIGMDGLTSGQSDKKPIPDLVKVNCYSAREGITYVADITLPKKEMRKLFAKTIKDTISWYENGDTRIINNNYFDLMCGCAPGGEIVMWISNGKSLEEIARAKGKEIKRESPKEREAYFNKMPPKEQAWIKNNPIPYGTWNKYNKKFTWKPDAVSGLTDLNKGFHIRISYVDGDFEFYNYEDWGYKEEDVKKSYREILVNSNEIRERGVPYFFEIYFFSETEGKGLRYETLLPVSLLKKYFENGFLNHYGQKQSFNRIVCEVADDRTLNIYLLGENGIKVLIKEKIHPIDWN